MAGHRIFCSKDVLSEVIRLWKERPYSTVLSTIEKLGNLFIENTSKEDVLKMASSNPIINKLLKRPSRKITCIKSAVSFLKEPQADDIFLMLPPDSKPYKDYRNSRGILLTTSLTDMQVIDDLTHSHFRPFHLLTADQKRKLYEHNEEYEDISSWQDVLSTISVFPINSAVIIDNYIFNNFERREYSLYSIIKALVPKGLSIPFHLTIFVYNKNGELKKDKMKQVIDEIHRLKLGSRIEVSIVAHTLGDVTHDRKILTNYHIITSGRGFGVIDSRGVRQNAQGEIMSTFHNICNVPSSYSIKHQHSHVLDWMKDIYIDKKGMDAVYAFEVGDDFTNRLISE